MPSDMLPDGAEPYVFLRPGPLVCWHDVGTKSGHCDDESHLTQQCNSLASGRAGDAELLLDLDFGWDGPVRRNVAMFDSLLDDRRPGDASAPGLPGYRSPCGQR
jgi:hypothetical protein